jgi:UDPglucose 6-dehydrogenase
MKICVLGIWHLGAVTSACLASLGYSVVGVDEDVENVKKLNSGYAPIFEPGLDALIVNGINSGFLIYENNPSLAVRDADVLWVTFDTPVDDEDRADFESVLKGIKKALSNLPENAMVIISSQLPVGSIAALEKFALDHHGEKNLSFSSIPENLRLGKALDIFLEPDRLVVGVRGPKVKNFLENFLLPITRRLEWMSIESAEMTKHAINAFLATSVTFANEIATICESVGADAKEVERGLKTESRIGPKAYLSPGGPFAGGTLARDIEYLGWIAKDKMLQVPLLSSVRVSNDYHKNWFRRKLLEYFGDLENIVVAVWGLTYKSGTDTMRRSLSIELCDWLLENGALVHVSDPVVSNFPSHWGARVKRFDSPLDAVVNAQALIVGAEWPQFRDILMSATPKFSDNFLVIDANRYIYDYLDLNRLKYLAVGTSENKMVIK